CAREMKHVEKYVIVNADDFGASAGVNRGILECHTRGVVTSTGLMVIGHAVSEVASCRALPFLEQERECHGPPPHHTTALQGAKRMRRQMPTTWPSRGRLSGGWTTTRSSTATCARTVRRAA